MKCFLIVNLTENKLPIIIIIIIQKQGHGENQAGIINELKKKNSIFLFFFSYLGPNIIFFKQNEES